MRIVIAGAAGFLGSNLSERLLRAGHEVVAVDNLVTGRMQNLAHLAEQPGFVFHRADVVQPLAVEGSLDWVMHFASPASPPKYLERPIETLRVNSEGTRYLLELARAKVARFFLASTSEIYGDPAVHPQPESYSGNVSPIGLRSVYNEGKRYGEALTMAYHRALGIDVRIARIFNTYGPRMDPDDGRVVSNFITRALRGAPPIVYGNGTQSRSFQYVDDLVEGIVRLMGVPYHEPVNLGNPQEHTVIELARLVQEIAGSSVPVVFATLPAGDPLRRRPDIALARRLLDWEPSVPIREGLARTIDYFRLHS